MTPKEAANAVVAKWSGIPDTWYASMSADIEQAISTAILSERQSIAQLITQEADKIEESSGPKAYRIPSSEVARLRNLATLILSHPIPPTP